MKVKVRAFGELTAYLGDELTVEMESGAALKDLISKLMEKTSGSKKDFLKRYDASSSDLVVLVNGHNIRTLNRLQTHLHDSDVVTLLPLAQGG